MRLKYFKPLKLTRVPNEWWLGAICMSCGKSLEGWGIELKDMVLHIRWNCIKKINRNRREQAARMKHLEAIYYDVSVSYTKSTDGSS